MSQQVQGHIEDNDNIQDNDNNADDYDTITHEIPTNHGTVTFKLPDAFEDPLFIATGSYGTVVRVIRRTDDGDSEIMIVKKLIQPFANNASAEHACREVAYSRHMKGSWDVADLEYVLPHYEDGNDVTDASLTSIYLVFENCGHNLAKVMDIFKYGNPARKSKPSRPNFDLIRVLTHNILCGLKYIHSSGLIHRDLKPANICVQEERNFKAKIIDFGMARTVRSIETDSNIEQDITDDPTIYVQTRAYRAPELILDYVPGSSRGSSPERNSSGYGYSIDIWSCGLIFLELITCEPTFNVENHTTHIGKIVENFGGFPYFDELSLPIQNVINSIEVYCDEMEEVVPLRVGNRARSKRDDQDKIFILEDELRRKINDDEFREQFLGNLESSESSISIDRNEDINNFINLLQKMLTLNVSRPNINQLLTNNFYNHPWIDKNSESDCQKHDTGEANLAPVVLKNQDVDYYRAEILRLRDLIDMEEYSEDESEDGSES